MSDKKEIVSASPKVRKLAREFGADIYKIEGSQRLGRVSEEDVKSYIKDAISGKSVKKQTVVSEEYDHSEFGEVDIQQIPRIKKIAGPHLEKSWSEIPHVTQHDEIDITGVGLADLERVKDVNDPLNSDLVSVPPSFTVSYIGFNVKEPPFDDLKFRLALNYAVDKQLIASQVYSDLVKPAYGILPPNFPGFSLDITGIEYDPDKAVQLLSESKYADASTRPPIVVTVPGTGGSPSLDMEVVSDMWDRILGIQIEIQQVEWATYLQDLHRRRLQVWGGSGWQADYPDPQDFIDILFHTESTNNHGNYSNTDADKFLEDARTEQDIYKRISLYNKAEQLIIDDAPWLPMWFDQEGLALIKPWVKGFNFTPMIVPKMKEVYIDKS